MKLCSVFCFILFETVSSFPNYNMSSFGRPSAMRLRIKGSGTQYSKDRIYSSLFRELAGSIEGTSLA